VIGLVVGPVDGEAVTAPTKEGASVEGFSVEGIMELRIALEGLEVIVEMLGAFVTLVGLEDDWLKELGVSLVGGKLDGVIVVGNWVVGAGMDGIFVEGIGVGEEVTPGTVGLEVLGATPVGKKVVGTELVGKTVEGFDVDG
jgi:hypothetical protein